MRCPALSTCRHALQRGVPPLAAALGQPSCWHRLPPPCAMQCCVSPRAALVQPSSWHRLTPPCAAYTRLRAALLLTLPPAHGTPPGSLNVCAAETSLRRVIHSRHPHPLSALDDPLVHIKPKTVAVREQVRRWVQHVSVNVVNSAWAGDVRWVCSWEGWTGTPPQPPPPGSQALPVVPLPQTPNSKLKSSNTPPAARCPQHDGGTPWGVPGATRVQRRPEGGALDRKPDSVATRRRTGRTA